MLRPSTSAAPALEAEQSGTERRWRRGLLRWGIPIIEPGDQPLWLPVSPP